MAGFGWKALLLMGWPESLWKTLWRITQSFPLVVDSAGCQHQTFYVFFPPTQQWKMWWRGRVILTVAILLVRQSLVCPQRGHWSWTGMWYGQGLSMSWTNWLTSVIHMQEECCFHIKRKTILTQTGGAVARENRLIEDLSGNCGLSGKTCCRVCD